MKLIPVFHGTSFTFKPEIEENGLIPPPTHGRGVRVHLTAAESLPYARAYAAWAMAEHGSYPKGLIVGAIISERRIKRDRDGILRVGGGLESREIHLRTVQFRELFHPAIAAQALELFEQITDQRLSIPFMPHRGVRRS